MITDTRIVGIISACKPSRILGQIEYKLAGTTAEIRSHQTKAASGNEGVDSYAGIFVSHQAKAQYSPLQMTRPVEQPACAGR